MWSMTLWEQGAWPAQCAVVVGAALIAAVTDLAWRRIPNWLTVPLLAGGLANAIWIGGAPGLADSFAAACMLALPYVLLFVFARGGAGDAKLMAAIGAWLGLVAGAVTLLAVAAAGIVLAVGVAMARGRLASVTATISGVAAGVVMAVLGKARVQDSMSVACATGTEQAMTIPYGVAIFAGVAAAATGVLIWQL